MYVIKIDPIFGKALIFYSTSPHADVQKTYTNVLHQSVNFYMYTSDY